MYVCLHIMNVPGTLRGQEGAQAPVTGIAGSCEPPCGCWELNLGPLQEKLLLASSPAPMVLEAFCLALFSVCPGFLTADATWLPATRRSMTSLPQPTLSFLEP